MAHREPGSGRGDHRARRCHHAAALDIGAWRQRLDDADMAGAVRLGGSERDDGVGARREWRPGHDAHHRARWQRLIAGIAGLPAVQREALIAALTSIADAVAFRPGPPPMFLEERRRRRGAQGRATRRRPVRTRRT